ncbi:MAG: tRNA (adenosine(37)-N6)-threonylcarbamoyltransferase complex transferase subunit TsaD [Alphaproteobacteria bacterium]|nr:MAG: tRNA (adenosine(37)-N6)-threonylcarbamoyltransferase complex transferase subunit TsaD [Alphaproteobacteria bacterium]
MRSENYLVLGIETSCDETAASVVSIHKKTGQTKILSNIVYSQIEEHKPYGGVIPEFAARAHLDILPKVVEQALVVDKSELDAVCATTGPGLIGGLHVGVCFGKSFAKALNIPFIPVNHLEGHALTACLTNDVQFPFLLLLISGGHTQIINVKNFKDYEVLGSSKDDSCGEMFDKTAKLMGLPYPGGPEIEKLARQGNENAFDFPKPFYKKPHCDFSFSGLKTAVKLAYKKTQHPHDIAASLQKTILDVLVDRLTQALKFAPHKTLVVAGGVASNQYIREGLQKFCDNLNMAFEAPPSKLCTDNAAMIAYVGGMTLYHQTEIQEMKTMPRISLGVSS